MFQSTVSNLQRLLNTASSSHAQRGGQKHLESVTEEAHTYDLLYPEDDTLLQGQHHAYPLRHGDPALLVAAANSPDDRGGLDIQSPRDVRIVIAQGENKRSPQPRVLYDTQPPVSFPNSRNSMSLEQPPGIRQRADSFTGDLTGDLFGGKGHKNGGRKPNTVPHSRHSSLTHTANSSIASPSSPLSPVNESGSLFGGSRVRNTSVRPATSDGETVQGKLAREDREETEALLDCMFGAATGFPSTSSTKLHVRPPKTIDITNENRPKSTTRDNTSTAAFPKRRTPLTRSTTVTDLQTLSTDANQEPMRQPSSAIWITRLFSVDLKDPAFSGKETEGSKPLESNQQHRQALTEIESSSGDLSQRDTGKDDKKAKQLKTPMYAIAILLQMPFQRQRPSTASHRSPNQFARSPSTLPFDGSTKLSIMGHDSNGSIDYVISHWAVIDRALSSLEVVARCKITNALSRLEMPHTTPPTREPLSSKSNPPVFPKKVKQPTQWTMQLPAGALQGCPSINSIVNMTGKRIVLALKIRKVIPGQGRWGIWREEARWVDKWAGGREQNFFFLNLLSAFVGSHTEWLDSLIPKAHKRRHGKVAERGRKETNAIHHRTVILSPDKMVARRLVFLLSAFLPGAHSHLFPEGRRQPDASWPNVQRSQSPPSGVSIARHRSLRRTINRGSRGNLNNNRFISHGRSISFSDADIVLSEGSAPDLQSQHDRSRRPSDARSVRSTALLITSDGSVTRKSSTTTTATIKPESAVPVAHFASHPSAFSDMSNGPRPSSSESLAPISLQRTLSRSENNEQGNASADSQPRSGWSSLVSYWSGRRGSSTEESDPLASSEEGLGISGISKTVRSQRSTPKLAQMVEEVENSGARRVASGNAKGVLDLAQADESPGVNESYQGPSPSRQIPVRPTPEVFPLKLSIDESDGVIDVDLPPVNSYPSSFESFMASPIGAQTAASSFNDRPTTHSSPSNAASQYSSSDTRGDIAGWLRNYHEDFALQAVHPYSNLKEDIKRSMRNEPTPSVVGDENNAADGWYDICSTIIADTRTYTVRRLRLQRKNPTSPHHRTRALLNNTDQDISQEEQIIEEPLKHMDSTFIEAVEKVLSHSGDSSRVASRAQSRAPSPTRHRDHPRTGGSPGLEIPRSECKRLVLGALEQVARSVSTELATTTKEQGNKDTEPERGSRHDGMPAENTLREGVRKWFREVDSHDTIST